MDSFHYIKHKHDKTIRRAVLLRLSRLIVELNFKSFNTLPTNKLFTVKPNWHLYYSARLGKYVK
jgi:hypothetical protein